MKFIIILFVIIAAVTIAVSDISLFDIIPWRLDKTEAPAEVKEDSDTNSFGETLIKAFFPSKDKDTEDVKAPIIQQQTSTEPAGFMLDTSITSGPIEGSTLLDTKVTFEYIGSAQPEQSKTIIYETKVIGIDSDWKRSSSKRRTITIPAGPGEYTFFVRSTIRSVVDQTPASRTFYTNTSPYLGKVSLSSVRTKSPPFSMTLRTSIASGESIDITGWTVDGNSGGFEIRQGIEKFHSVLNPFLSNIVLKRSDKVLIKEGRSPFGRNVSFRPNLCFGYLRPFYDFVISVPRSCPDRATLGEVTYLNPICQDFVLNDIRTSSCTVPNTTTIQGDSECLSFISNRYNYDACYDLHSKEPGFDENEWHVYIERSFGHPLHDVIELLDENGRLVDSYIY